MLRVRATSGRKGSLFVEMIMSLVLEALAVRWFRQNQSWMESISDWKSTKSDGVTMGLKRVVSYNKILMNRIRDEVNPILRKNQAIFRPGRSCAQQIHILRRVLEGFRDYQLPLVVTFIDFKKAFDSINRKVMFAILRHYGIPEAVVNAFSVLYKNSKSAVSCDGGWRPIWSIWRHYWSPTGRCSGSFSICCAGWLPAEKGHVAAWLWSCNPSSSL